MDDNLYILKRRLRNKTVDFPQKPVWEFGHACAGLCYIGTGFRYDASLDGVRDKITSIWEGELRPEIPITILKFSSPVTFGEYDNPTVLRLQHTKPGTMASFSADGVLPKINLETPVQRVEIWWGGKPRSLSTNGLRRVSLAKLYSMPTLHIHEGREFQSIESHEIDSVSESEIQEKDENISSVKIAEHALGSNGKGVFGKTDEMLAKLDEDTKLGNILGRIFRGRAIGEGGGKGKGGGSGTGIEAGPGLLESLAGWVRWHTPLGSGLAKQFGDRMNLVEKLINKGDIDSALKLALKLGRGDKGRKQGSRFPLRLPDMRSGLNFDVTNSGFSMPILGGRSHVDLVSRYSKLAEELENNGDYRRAAYIRSQLLDSHYSAVLTLERGEMFEDAAKLAFDSRQEPALVIRLYYKAGKTDIALALAKRTECFDRLVEESRKDNPEFHNYAVKAWTDMLTASGQYARALEVTDGLAKGVDGYVPDQDLIALRLDWLTHALSLELSVATDNVKSFSPDLIARAILDARWDGRDLDPTAMVEFPNAQNFGNGPFAQTFAIFQDIATGNTPDIMVDVLASLGREASRRRVDQQGFWEGPAKVIIDRFARSVLANASENLQHHDLVSLRNIVQQTPLPVLAVDLGKLKQFNKKPKRPPNFIYIEEPSDVRTARINKACILCNGSMVIWYDTNRLELRNRLGTVIWTQQVADIRDLVPLGSSPTVMVLRKHDEFETRLTKLETHKRKFTDIGIVHLIAWHDTTSDGQWLVQIDNIIGALDLVKLCKKMPELEFNWSVETSNEMKVMAFMQAPQASSWLTRNMTSVRFGAMQIWRFLPSGDLETSICVPAPEYEDEIALAEINWKWAPLPFSKMSKFDIFGIKKRHLINYKDVSYDARKEAIAFAQKRLNAGYVGDDTVQVCDFQRQSIEIISDENLLVARNLSDQNDHFTISFKGEPKLRLLARGSCFKGQAQEGSFTDISNIALCTDAYGRLIRVDRNARRVDLF